MCRAWVVVACLVAFQAICISALSRARHIGAINEGLRVRGLWASDEQRAKETATSDQWFTQSLDHFDRTNTQTWQQRYLVNDTYFEPGKGPIFLILGGEGPISAAYVSGHFISSYYASLTGALQVALEHRFYGSSVPNNDSSVENLQFLSSEQALADAAVFRDFIVNQYNCANCPVIVFGGSYSGCLSAWLKYKYPHLITGSYATSAPVQALLDFSAYFQVVQRSVGATCAARIKAASNTLDSLVSTPNGKLQVERQFNTCSPLVTAKDVATFMSDVSGTISGVVQYNLDNVQYQPCNITKMCDMIENSDPDPVQALANFNNFANAFSQVPCVEVNYTQTLVDMSVSGAGRSWTYQTCVEFGFFQTAETDDQPFSRSISLQYYLDMCYDLFGVPAMIPDTNWTNTNYGSTDLQTSNTVMPNGDVDPWHMLGVLNRQPGPNSLSTLITGTAHCADLYGPRAEDLPSLRTARAEIFPLLLSWINGPE